MMGLRETGALLVCIVASGILVVVGELRGSEKISADLFVLLYVLIMGSAITVGILCFRKRGTL
jgi:hypothetical protein